MKLLTLLLSRLFYEAASSRDSVSSESTTKHFATIKLSVNLTSNLNVIIMIPHSQQAGFCCEMVMEVVVAVMFVLRLLVCVHNIVYNFPVYVS